MLRYLAVFLALAAVLAAPVLLKPETSARTQDFRPEDRLVIVTPHVETLRYEFEIGFQKWMEKNYQRKVVIDWRVPGGTSEISKVVESEYTAALENLWKTTRQDPWKAEYARAFLNPADKSEARQVWMDSAVGIGMDLFFGGGTIDFMSMKDKGCIVPGDLVRKTGVAGVKELHPDWFTDAAIPEVHGGETFYDHDLAWVGACMSSFGVCYNDDFFVNNKIDHRPDTWRDLMSPDFENQLALADPGKSGTVVKMFENILQQEIQAAVASAPTSEEAGRAAAIETGWQNGLRVIQRIGANARYWTDSSAKIPLDVVEGEAAVGMCIDFYARNFIERLEQEHGTSRLHFALPRGGTSNSVDPIAMFRGAPNPELATRFIEFVLSMEGQRLWGCRTGTPGGPVRMALRRLPVRRDFYTPDNLKDASDPDVLPYSQADLLVYDPAYTGRLFKPIRTVIRAMCLDTHEELKAAWHALIAAGFPPEATAAFDDMSDLSSHRVTTGIADQLKGRDYVLLTQLSQQLATSFRTRYHRVLTLAKAGK